MTKTLRRYSTDLPKDHWIRKQAPRRTSLRPYAEDWAITNIIDQIGKVIRASGQNRAQLAKALGVTKSQVSQWLNGEGNMTLKTLAGILWACGREIDGLKTAPVAGPPLGEREAGDQP